MTLGPPTRAIRRFGWKRRRRWRRRETPFLLQFTLRKDEVQVPDYIDEKAAHYPDFFLIQAFGKRHGKGCGQIGKLFRGAIIHHPKPPHNIVCGILESSDTTKAAPPVKPRGAVSLTHFLKSTLIIAFVVSTESFLLPPLRLFRLLIALVVRASIV